MCTTGMLKHGSRRFQVCYISANSSLFNEHITGQSNGKRYCNVWDRQTDRRAPVINAIRNPLWDAKQLGSATCSWTRCLVALLYFRHSSVTAIYAYLSLSPSLSLQRTSYQLVRLSCVLLSRPTICPSVRSSAWPPPHLCTVHATYLVRRCWVVRAAAMTRVCARHH